MATQAPESEGERLIPTEAKDVVPGVVETPGAFWDSKHGVYFTYTKRDIKAAMCRALMKVLFMAGVFASLFLLWGVCDLCIMLVAVGSCALTCLGFPFLGPSCVLGALVCLLRGFRFGSELASVDVHWKI